MSRRTLATIALATPTHVPTPTTDPLATLETIEVFPTDLKWGPEAFAKFGAELSALNSALGEKTKWSLPALAELIKTHLPEITALVFNWNSPHIFMTARKFERATKTQVYMGIGMRVQPAPSAANEKLVLRLRNALQGSPVNFSVTPEGAIYIHLD